MKFCFNTLFLIFHFCNLFSQKASPESLTGLVYIDQYIIPNKEFDKGFNSIDLETFSEVEKEYYKIFRNNIPDYLESEKLLDVVKVDYVGVSSPFNRDEIPEIIEVINSKKIEFVFEEKVNEIDKRLFEIRKNIISDLELMKQNGNSSLDDLTTFLLSKPEDQFFDISRDGINIALDTLVYEKIHSVLQNEHSGLRKKINHELADLNADIQSYGEGYEILIKHKVDRFISYSNIKSRVDENLKTYHILKESSPKEALLLLQQNDIYLKFLEKNNLAEINQIASDVLKYVDKYKLDEIDIDHLSSEIEKGWDKVEEIFNGDLELTKNDLSNLTVGRTFDDFFINQEHKELSAKYMYYSTIGILDGPLRKNLGLKTEDIYKAHDIGGNISFGVVQFYSGDYLGGVQSILSGLGGLFGQKKRKRQSAQVALAGMISKGFNRVFDNQRRLLDNQKKLFEGQRKMMENQVILMENQKLISEQISQMHKQMWRNDSITWSMVHGLHKQIMKNDSLIVVMLNEIDQKIIKTHKELRKFHISTKKELESIQLKLDGLINQSNCIFSAIQEVGLKAFDCRGAMDGYNGLIKLTDEGKLNSLDDYGDVYHKECIKGLKYLPDRNNLATLLLDYNRCFERVDNNNISVLDLKKYFAMIKELWNDKFGKSYNQEVVYVSLLNPSRIVVGNSDTEMIRQFKKAQVKWSIDGDLLNNVNKINQIDGDALNNVHAVIDITRYYLYALPMMAKSNGSFEEIIDKEDYGRYLKLGRITHEVDYYKKLLEITIAQQSLLSGTMVLSHIDGILSNDKLSENERKNWILVLKYNPFLAFNYAKFIKQRYRQRGNRFFLSQNLEVSCSEYEFSISLAIDSTTNDSVKKEMVKLEIAGIDAVNEINKPDRLLPKEFYELIDLHQKYTILFAELKTLKELDPDTLLELKKLYLN